MRELAEALAEHGNKVLIWDRPNCGESDVCFEGSSESAMQADALAGLLAHLDMNPAVIAGGSGGARVSLLTAARHPESAAGLAIWWISGGIYGLLSLATHYCGGSVGAAWTHGMEAVADLPEWAEVQELNPSNRQRFLSQDRGDVHRHDGDLDAGLLPPRRRARAGPARRRGRAARRSRRSSSAAARATPTTPGRRRRRWPSCCPRAGWSSRRGATGNGSSARARGKKGCSPTGRCWPRSSWSGRPKSWARLSRCRRLSRGR